MNDLFMLALAMLATGAFSGVLAGLFGIGGGIVIVPALDFALSLFETDPAIRMHIAVATSLATIVPTSISSARAHHRRGAVDLDIVRAWAPFVLLGSVAGAWLASRLHSDVLAAVFAVMALAMGVKMLLPLDGTTLADGVSRGPAASTVPFAIGGVSSMMGIGGGTLSVAALTLCSQPMHRAVGTAALFGLVISLPATAGFVVLGLADPRLPPASLGYVNLIGFALIAPTTWLAAPAGVALAHRLSQRQLGAAFGLFLVIVSVRMLARLG